MGSEMCIRDRESIGDRIVQLEKDGDNYDDLHKARMKLKHVKETLMELEVKAVEQNVDLIKYGYREPTKWVND